MDIDRMAGIVHALAATPSRRRVSRFVAGLTAGTLLAPLVDPITGEAKKKHKHKKKKKKCKSGTKKCGKQCIPATGCCSADDCGPNEACEGNTCNCANGFVETCVGTCIPDEPGLVVCCEPGILCEDDCCDVTAGEVCHSSDSAPSTCQAGGCPAVGLCESADSLYFCAQEDIFDDQPPCYCTTPIEGGASVCVSLGTTNSNNTCTSSSGCGAGGVCIACGPGCLCEEDMVGFCGTLCSEGCGANCSQRALSRAHRQTGSVWMDVLAPKLSGHKRPSHR